MKLHKYCRTMLMAALVLTLLLSITGGTIAWFTDEAASNGNIIKSGTLDVEMTYYDEDSATWKSAAEGAIFDYQLWEPGYTQLRKLKITNAGDLAFKYQLNFLSDIPPAVGTANLADVIDIYYGTDAAPTDRAGVLAATRAGTVAEMAADAAGVELGVLLPAGSAATGDEAVGETELWVALHMQESAGNEYQNLSVGDGFTVKLLAAQYTFEEDSFDNTYDEDATYDLGITTLADIVPELEAKYAPDASVVPAGLTIDDTTETITIGDKESLLYFAYVLDPAEAYQNSQDVADGHGYTSIWYPNASARDIKLAADIDLEGLILPEGMGNMGDFRFDGQNHVIKNAKVTYEGTDSAALFVGRNRGVSNLVVENVSVTAPNVSSGSAGIVCSNASAHMDNITVRNSSVAGGKYSGAIVGYNYGDITNCTVENCTVSNRYKVGGLVGYLCSDGPDTNRKVTGNTLTNVSVEVVDLLDGKSPVVGQVVGNWNALVGECTNNTITNVVGPTQAIGEVEAACVAGLVQD